MNKMRNRTSRIFTADCDSVAAVFSNVSLDVRNLSPLSRTAGASKMKNVCDTEKDGVKKVSTFILILVLQDAFRSLKHTERNM